MKERDMRETELSVHQKWLHREKSDWESTDRKMGLGRATESDEQREVRQLRHWVSRIESGSDEQQDAQLRSTSDNYKANSRIWGTTWGQAKSARQSERFATEKEEQQESRLTRMSARQSVRLATETGEREDRLSRTSANQVDRSVAGSAEQWHMKPGSNVVEKGVKYDNPFHCSSNLLFTLFLCLVRRFIRAQLAWTGWIQDIK